MNLLSNAVKFQTEGNILVSAEIKVEKCEEENKLLAVISVRDQGIGMNEEETKNIFDQFYKGKSQIHLNSAGIGLGLAISKKICENLEGSISVESAPNLGSKFTFSMKVIELKDESPIFNCQTDELASNDI